jgi:hypothetical protein
VKHTTDTKTEPDVVDVSKSDEQKATSGGGCCGGKS